MKADFSILEQISDVDLYLRLAQHRDITRDDAPYEGRGYKWDGERFVFSGFLFEKREDEVG